MDDDGNALADGIQGEKLLWDETCKPAPRTAPGFVIDLPHFKTVAKLDYRMTFFSNSFQA